MTDREKTSKYLVEYFGGCWHEWEPNPLAQAQFVAFGTPDFYCSKCDTDGDGINLDLFTWPGFGWLKGKLEKAGKWKDFRKRRGCPELNVRCVPYSYNADYIDANLIDPLTFPTRVRKFLEEI